MKVKNASIMPKRYFGLHMVEGLAEYPEAGKEPLRIFVGEPMLKRMDKTFEGKPVYVDHVEEVDPATIEGADGYVVKSFYNSNDGKHWVEFLVVTDRAHDAIKNGWRLSNAYLPTSYGAGGMWHGMEYSKEVLEGEYEHLAIVDNPRYAESVILTPEQFKEYNEKKSGELLQLANSNSSKGAKSMFKFFKKEKLENSADLENTSVRLPESKKEITISEALGFADKFLNASGYADMESKVKVNDDEMSVRELVSSYGKMCAKKNEEEEEKKKENEEEEEKKANEDKEEEKKENEDKDEEEKKDNKKKKNSDENFNKLKNAGIGLPDVKAPQEIDLNGVDRGISRYGSKK